MHEFNIDVMCIQETRKQVADSFKDNGVDIILSGDGGRRAGVGFINAPRARRLVNGFLQHWEDGVLKAICERGQAGDFHRIRPSQRTPSGREDRFLRTAGGYVQQMYC